ncbi:M1 family metallopeptidase [Sphingomicrobium lutaoense]|uniref:Aminopeptidase N n=1 Tax=Sphingomicrobium lutaoense TaxID=515949 RepID=A0A839Z109_9SPHN|nr:M1 family metallopeptidase [Sphingomicrobium lutaoense]MBB3765019.1 aminopeptidase N [Sphingomicrobium lutaoense]
MSARLFTLALSALLLASCRSGDEAPQGNEMAANDIAPILDREDAVDVHSYAKPLEARVYHVALDLDVDFDAKRVAGTATLDIDAKDDAEEIILDSRGLTINSVTAADGEPLAYEVGEEDETLGAPISVKIGDARRIVIDYVSAENSTALQFLSPEQTAGGRHPFLLSQGQAIENRSWIPTQDSPGIRQTWEAKIRVPNPLTAVMSAATIGDPVPDGKDHRIFSFEMEKSVPPYLIAIAVGEIEKRSLGLRSAVWAEPETIDAAAAELADTERMITAAERLFGPYEWGRYDMIVLPPSFPFGGMENPRLTFLTPTFIAGDKSLTSLIAHELAHSWSGNLATNATWADFWLNEGMTVYAEQRIVEAVYGKEAYDQQVALSLEGIRGEIEELEEWQQALAIDLKGKHPDDGFNGVPYEKGAAFLRTIEAAVGREAFDAFLKGWFERHAFEPVTSSMFLEEVREYLIKGDEELEASLRLDEWVYEAGIPDNVAPANPEAFAEVDAAVKAFDNGETPNREAWVGWNTDERLRFLGSIETDLPNNRLAALDRAFGLSQTGNNEILFLWLKLAVENRYDPALPRLEEFLTSQGRRKFVAPLITALAEDKEWGMPIAKRLYAKARPLYHPITTRGLDLLGIKPDLPGGTAAGQS